MSDKLTALLLARREEITTADPERASSFGLTVIFSTIEATVLFGETRSGAFDFSDDEIAAELSRVFLAYLGVSSRETRVDTKE